MGSPWFQRNQEKSRWWFDQGDCWNETVDDAIFTPQEGDHFTTGQHINVSWHGDKLSNWDRGQRSFTWNVFLQSLDDITCVPITINRTWTTPYDGDCNAIDSCGNTQLVQDYVIPTDLRIEKTLFEIIVVNVTDAAMPRTTTGNSFVINPTDFVAASTQEVMATNSLISPTNPNGGSNQPITANTDDDGSGNASGGLSASQGIGIGVGLSASFIFLAAVIFFFWRRWNKQKQVSELEYAHGGGPMPPRREPPTHGDSSELNGVPRSEVEGSSPSMTEATANSTVIHEIMEKFQPAPAAAELDGTPALPRMTSDVPSPATSRRPSSDAVQKGRFLDV